LPRGHPQNSNQIFSAVSIHIVGETTRIIEIRSCLRNRKIDPRGTFCVNKCNSPGAKGVNCCGRRGINFLSSANGDLRGVSKSELLR
jgi:hypothetical protein